MGIPYLTRHLLPYADAVVLGSSDNTELPRLQSLVVDGPSLVYDVYYRLLASMSPACNVLDVQPTCNEVSRGVVSFLYQLASLGVEVYEKRIPPPSNGKQMSNYASEKRFVSMALCLSLSAIQGFLGLKNLGIVSSYVDGRLLLQCKNVARRRRPWSCQSSYGAVVIFLHGGKIYRKIRSWYLLLLRTFCAVGAGSRFEKNFNAMSLFFRAPSIPGRISQ